MKAKTLFAEDLRNLNVPSNRADANTIAVSYSQAAGHISRCGQDAKAAKFLAVAEAMLALAKTFPTTS